MANQEHLAILMQGIEVWNPWRNEHPDIRPDLREADLAGMNLDGMDLTWTDLNGANLTDASLNYADLTKADLSLAKMSGATLHMALLSQTLLILTELMGANLSEAVLSFACLSVANLSQANLEKVMLVGTAFVGINFSEVHGLETIEHIGPSSIDVQTLLINSGGNVPDIFWHGCGLPHEFIELIGSPIQYYSCFISYSHVDKPFEQRVYDILQNRAICCWEDDHDMKIGDPIYEALHKGITEVDKVVLIISKSSLNSSWVERELNMLFAKEEGLSKRKGRKETVLIPVDLSH